MGVNFKHHTVPQCYLDHFATNGQIYKYSKVRKMHNRCSVKDVCESNSFYLIKDNSWWKHLEIESELFAKNVEPALSKMIDVIEQAVKNVVCDNSNVVKIKIDQETRKSIASLVFIQFYRTPRFRNFYNNKAVIRKGISSTTHEYTEEKVTDEVLVHALSTFCNKPLFKQTVDYLSSNQWVIRYSDKDVFLTSDNPVVWIPLKENDSDVFTIGNIGNSRCFLYYPITPQIVLEIYDKGMKSLSPDFDNLVIRCDAEHETFLNINTIINAADDVILRDKDISTYSIDIKLNII